MAVTKDIDIDTIKGDYDWKAVFGEDSGGNTSKATDAIPPHSKVDTTPPNLADVKTVIAAVNGENDGAEWLGLFELNDGRFCVAGGGCDYTGWDCQAGNHISVAASLDDAIRFGLSEQERARLGLTL